MLALNRLDGEVKALPRARNAYQECAWERLLGRLPQAFPLPVTCPKSFVDKVYFHMTHDLDCAEELDSLGVFRALKRLALENEYAMECLCDLNITALATNRIFDEGNRPAPLCIEFPHRASNGGREEENSILLRVLRPKHEFGENRPNFEVGFTLWGASLVFCKFVCERPEIFQGKRVLELGSGIGLGGLAVAQCASPQQVLLSDFHPNVLENCAFNAKLNGLDHIVSTIPLDWELVTTAEDVVEQYPVIIGTDVICQEADCESVCQVLLRMLAPRGTAVFVLGGAESRYGVDKFVPKLMEHGFTIHEHTVQDGSLEEVLLPNTTLNLDMVVGKAKCYHTLVLTKELF